MSEIPEWLLEKIWLIKLWCSNYDLSKIIKKKGRYDENIKANTMWQYS